jgi:hypothetical protein
MAIGSVHGEGLAEVVRRTSQELGLDHPAARGRAVLAAGLVAVSFGAAFAVGAATKPAAAIHTPQLAPASSATGSQVSVVAPAATTSIPSLAHKVVVKPVVHHATKKATHQARHHTTSSTSKHSTTVSTTHHTVAPVVHTTPPVTTPPPVVNTTPAVTTPPVTTPPVTHTTTTTPPSSTGSSKKPTGNSGGSSNTGTGITSGGG